MKLDYRPFEWRLHHCLRGLFFVSGMVLIAACASQQPSLDRLYNSTRTLSDQTPVILVHGAFGARLCDASGQEFWPGSLANLLFADYQELALPIRSDTTNTAIALTTCGMTDSVAGQDFYGEIEHTLTGPGGYVLTTPGSAVDRSQRHYYRFVYDWRQDNSASAAALDQLVEQIRADHKQPNLKVDIVAHSMGGLVTRYWLRYGTEDVLNNNDFPLNNSGGEKARKVVLVGTPSLGSTSALQQLLRGGDFGVNKIPPEVLLSFPSGYQLLPHPIVDSIIGNRGQVFDRDIYDRDIWRALSWGPYDPNLRQRLQEQDWSNEDLAALEAYNHIHLERARRFVWSLTIENNDPPTELIVFGGDCVPTPARILIEDIGDQSLVRLWPTEIERPLSGINYQALMLEPGDGAVTKASLLARTELDPTVPRHRFSDFPLNYSVMFCEDHSKLPGNLTFQDNLLHILLSR